METKTVLIQKTLLKDLEGFILEYNEYNKPHIKLDIAVYFLSLFISLPSYYRNTEKENYLVSLYSKKLKGIFSKYTKFLDFLIDSKIIEKAFNYSTDKGTSNQYRLTEKYLFDDIIGYEITDKSLLKKFEITTNENKNENDNLKTDKRAFCLKKRPHLVRYFDDNLTIDKTLALEIIKPYKELNYAKYQSGMQLISEYNKKDWKYSINPNSDNRLHTNLTRTNKELRKCLYYKEDRLSAVDIRASQPFFFAVFLKAFLKKDYKLVKQIGASKLISKKKFEELCNLDVNSDEIIAFVEIILTKDFYINFSNHLEIPIDEEGKPYKMKINYFEPRSKLKKRRKIDFEQPRIKESFETKRDYAKSVMMEVFFSSPRTTTKEAKQFRNLYPSVSKVMSFIKDNSINFDKLLSHIESYCLLDYVALRFNKNHKNIPLWSIHDSLVTTKQNIHLLKEEVEQLLSEVTTIKKDILKDIIVIDNW